MGMIELEIFWQKNALQHVQLKVTLKVVVVWYKICVEYGV